jgi:hypothetical protein
MKITRLPWEVTMDRATAKVFVTGRSQAIQIPKEFRFDCEKETYG